MSEDTQIVEHSEQREIAPSPARRDLSIEDAHVLLQNKRAERSEPEPEKAVVEAPEEIEESTPEVIGWSTEDAQTIAALEREAEKFKQDLAVYAQYKNADLEKLTNGDKGQLALVKQQLREIGNELKQRFHALQEVALGIKGKADEMNAKAVNRQLNAEWKKLKKEKPDYDPKANKEFLKSLGASEEEISAITDHRLAAIIDDARRYREQQRKNPPKKVAVYRKGAKQQEPPKADPEYTAAIERVNKQGLNRQDAATILNAKPKPKKPATVERARKRLKQSGSLDDAYELLQAQKRASQ